MPQDKREREDKRDRWTLRRVIIVIIIIIIILLLIGGCTARKLLKGPAVVDPPPVGPGVVEPIPTPDPDPTHEHKYKSENHSPTCTEEGYTLFYCSCGDQYKENVRPALGHDMKKTAVVAPTYDSYGYTVYICSRCGARERRDFVAKHVPSVVIPSKPDPLTPEELEKIQKEIDDKVALGLMNVSMACNPAFETGSSAGWLKIWNAPQNRYPQVVKIVRSDTGELIYTSGVVPVGSRIDTDTLDAELPAGSYDCVAYFYPIDPDTGKEIGCIGAKIVVTVKS